MSNIRMLNLNYQQFVRLLGKLDKIDEKMLQAIYMTFGKKVVNDFFVDYISKLNEEQLSIFKEKYFCYFEHKDNGSELQVAKEKNSTNYKLEYLQALILNDCRDKIEILRTGSEHDDAMFYPNLDMAKIFLSVKTQEDLESIIRMKKLRYSVDDSIFRNEINFVNRFLKLSSNEILGVTELKKEFSELSFDNAIPVSNLSEQVELLENYILVKINFFKKNQHLIFSRVNDLSFGLPFNDRRQVANLAMVKAINKFDPTIGTKFSTYATYYIDGSIKRYFHNFGSVIRIPVSVHENIGKYRSFIDEYIISCGSEPSVSECAENLKMEESTIFNLKFLSLGVDSLDVLVDIDDEVIELIELIKDDSLSIEEICILRDMRDIIVDTMEGCLKERSRTILLELAGFNDSGIPRSVQEIADQMGIKRQGVDQNRKRSVKKLVKELMKVGITSGDVN